MLKQMAHSNYCSLRVNRDFTEAACQVAGG